MLRIKFVLFASGALVLIAACSVTHHAAKARPAVPRVTAPTTSAPAPASPKAAAGLSGTWSGTYGGAYHGTFTLTWQQSGSRLGGTIKLSSPASTLPIHGTVNGNAIRFGTVGSVGITYSGTVSGNSMSGTYQVHSANGPVGGPWSASKTSG